MSWPGIEPGLQSGRHAGTLEKNHSNILLIAIRSIYIWAREQWRMLVTLPYIFCFIPFSKTYFFIRWPGGTVRWWGPGSWWTSRWISSTGPGPSSARSPSLSWTMDTEVSLYDHLYYEEDQWSQHVAQPGAHPSPSQWIRKWVFMIIFIKKLINWARNLSLS